MTQYTYVLRAYITSSPNDVHTYCVHVAMSAILATESSDGGLGGGAVAAIVIFVLLIVVAVVVVGAGLLIFFYYKGNINWLIGKSYGMWIGETTSVEAEINRGKTIIYGCLMMF